LCVPEGKIDFADHAKNLDLWDKIFENNINSSIEKATQNFDEMKYK
jgi:hypothetical protein